VSQKVKNESEWEQKGNQLLKVMLWNFMSFIPQLAPVAVWNVRQTELVQCAGYWFEWESTILHLRRVYLFSSLVKANFLFPGWLIL